MMNCPNCGKPEEGHTITCEHCGEAHTNRELLELRQLEFLVTETYFWNVAQKWRKPYVDKLEAILEKMEAARKPPEPKPAVQAVAAAAAAPKPVALPKPAPKPAPPKEKVPFDQWLLSERNIKFALYSGAVLLVLAGIIFVGINWGRIPGMWKFAITLATSGLMYLGGYLLFHRPAFRLGGNALLAIACGFFALNFAVLQNYVLGERGIPVETTGLFAAPLCLLLYAFTAYWTKESLFTYFSLAALGYTLNSALVLGHASAEAFPLAFLLTLLALLILAARLRNQPIEAFTVKPILVVTHVLTPLGLLLTSIMWINPFFSSFSHDSDAWLAIGGIAAATTIYACTDWLFHKILARWITAALGGWLVLVITAQLEFSDAGTGVSMLLLAIAYLGLGYLIESSGENETKGGRPFFLFGYLIALVVTMRASAVQADLAKILLADVALLAVSAYIHKDYRWIFAAVWLFILPYYLFIDIAGYGQVDIGILMGVLGLVYAAAGYYLGRNRLSLGVPFLSAAVFLNALTVVLTWQDVLVVSLALLVNAGLYTFAAVWQKRPQLLLASLAAISLMVIPIASHYTDGFNQALDVSLISLMIMGTLMVIGAMLMRQSSVRDWGWPLYLVGGVNMNLAYWIGLTELSNWLVVAFSIVAAVISFTLAWSERSAMREFKPDSLLSYLGIGALFIGHFYLLDELVGRSHIEIWPLYTSAYLAAFVVASWLLRGSRAYQYEAPFWYSGLLLMSVPLTMALSLSIVETRIIVFAIAGSTYLADAWLRREALVAYAGAGSYTIAYFIGLSVWSNWMTVGMSLLSAALLFLLGWLVKRSSSQLEKINLLSYVAIGILFVGHFALLDEIIPRAWSEFTPVFTAVFTTLLIVVSWLLPDEGLGQFYAVPFRLSGLVLMVLPVQVVALSTDATVLSMVFGVMGAAYLADAWLRKQSVVAYASAGAFVGAYLAGLSAWENWLVVVLSPLGAAILYFLAVLIRRSTPKFVDIPVLQYAALAMLYGGYYHLLQGIPAMRMDETWPAFSAAFALLLVAVNWLLKEREIDPFYALPFRYAGLVSLPVFAMSAATSHPYLIASVTYALTGTAYAADAYARNNTALAYSSVGFYIGALWSLLTHFEISEQQAYVFPLAIALLALGWYERFHRSGEFYFIFTAAGLVVLMGSAFQQSLADNGAVYALLLAVECLLAIGWGIRTHSRIYVQFGGIALVTDALVQYGPAILDLDRWIQMGSIGLILLAMGMLALGKREQVLNTRRRLTEEWRGWSS